MSEQILTVPTAAPPSPETGHTILIIDDEAGIRESLETLLTL